MDFVPFTLDVSYHMIEQRLDRTTKTEDDDDVISKTEDEMNIEYEDLISNMIDDDDNDSDSDIYSDVTICVLN